MDPITFSIIRHRLYRIIEEAVITLKHVSGSAITNEGHDLMVSLYRTDGTLLMGGVGYLHHLTAAAEACKAVLRRFDGKINEGDVFLLNDPYTAALHTSDIYLVSPIHYDGQLVCFSASFVHVYDIGALAPGGFSPDSEDIYTEGFSSPGIKLIDRGEMREDVMDTILNMVRSPEMVALDLASMIACNNVAKDRMLALIDKYGAPAIDEAGRTLIDQSEALLRRRLRELPDGRWEARQYMEAKDEVYRVNMAMTKTEDSLTFDLTGSSPETPYGLNCTRLASWGGIFAPLFPMLCYDITWNEGLTRPVEMIAPEGSIVNCRRPAPVSAATVGTIQSVNNLAVTTIGKMLAASDKYRHETSAVWHANHVALFLFGRNQKGSESIGMMTETFAGSGGARSFADGIDVGGELPNPITRMANVETTEAMFPVRYLFRRRMKDSGGPGRYRGGTGGEIAVVPHDSPDDGLRFVISGKGSQFPMSDGLAGGYPGAPNSYVWVHNNEASEAGRNVNPFTQALEDMAGEQQSVAWGVYPLAGEDALYYRWNGGGGYGDPLEREADAVREDCSSGVVSEAVARQVYGVVLEGPSGDVDQKATERARERVRASRLAATAAE